jgi:pimeloyl-ACP methyl ester carboxylesterase
MNFIIKRFILLCSIIILFCSSGIFGQDAAETDIHEHPSLIHEPVFNSNIYLRETGKDFNQSIMLVHGIGEDASDIWKNLIPVLEKQYHLIYFDLPGFGRSDNEDSLYSPEQYTQLIKWIYDTYIKRPMSLIGHSMGGAISLYYSGTYPETVQKLILVDAAGILHGAALSRSVARINLEGLSKLGMDNEQMSSISDFIKSVFETTSRSLPKDISIVLETPLLRRLIFNNPKKIASAALINTNFSVQIEKANVPLFIIWGDKDPIAPLRTGRMLSYLKSGSPLKIMPGLGHNPMLEKPSDFNKLIEECIANDARINGHQTSFINKKKIIITGKENLVLEGIYDTIDISNCRNIIIKNAKSGNIKIKNSTVEIDNSVVISGNTGMYAADSEIIVTGCSITSGVGLSLYNSKLDLAGVKITGRKAAVSSVGEMPSVIIFSVCKIKSPFNDRYYHEVTEITKDKSL